MSNHNKTLIILTPGFPANEADSTCMPFPQLLVKTLKQINAELDIIVLSFQYPFTSEPYNWHNIKVMPFNGRNKRRISRLLVWNAVRKKLKRLVKENNVIGILNLWLGECSLIGNYIGKKYQIPTFTWLLGQDARPNNKYFRYTRLTTDKLIALSDFLADEFERNYSIRPAHIIPPGIPTNVYPQKQPRKIDIMGAGSLIPLKQYNIFIKVIAEIKKTNPEIKAILCGNGSERDNLQDMIIESGLDNNIELTGEISHSEVLELMQQAKIFLHPSSYEGFATVISEALYAGAHVVSFCKPMNVDFKHHHVVTDENGMINKVKKLLADRQDHDPVITYTIESTCNKLLALYGN